MLLREACTPHACLCYEFGLSPFLSPPCIILFSMQSPLVCSSTIVTAAAQRWMTLAWVSRTFLRVGTCTINETDVLSVDLAETFTEKQSVERPVLAQELLQIFLCRGLCCWANGKIPVPGHCPCSFIQSRPRGDLTGARKDIISLASSETTSLEKFLSVALLHLKLTVQGCSP